MNSKFCPKSQCDLIVPVFPLLIIGLLFISACTTAVSPTTEPETQPDLTDLNIELISAQVKEM